MKNLLVFSLLFAFASCHNHETEADNTPYVVAIKINSPQQNATFSIEQFYNIDIVFERPDKATIHNVDISVVDAATSKVVSVLKQGHVHAQSPYRFEQTNFRINQKGKLH